MVAEWLNFPSTWVSLTYVQSCRVHFFGIQLVWEATRSSLRSLSLKILRFQWVIKQFLQNPYWKILQLGTLDSPHTQSTNETSQAYSCMTFWLYNGNSASEHQNVCERVWWNFSCTRYKQVTSSQMFSDYCLMIVQIVISEDIMIKSSCNRLIQAGEIPHRWSAITICKIMRQ